MLKEDAPLTPMLHKDGGFWQFPTSAIKNESKALPSECFGCFLIACVVMKRCWSLITVCKNWSHPTYCCIVRLCMKLIPNLCIQWQQHRHYIDNAVAESFWTTLKQECLPLNRKFSSRNEAIEKISNWISYYNDFRPHSALGMLSPYQYRNKVSAWF